MSKTYRIFAEDYGSGKIVRSFSQKKANFFNFTGSKCVIGNVRAKYAIDFRVVGLRSF